jgi:hypothetical protein
LRPILNSSPIQHIVFPPHHQDPPDAVAKCKGFALVTLTEPPVVSHLLTLFPYETDDAHDDDENSVSSIEESEARKAGFRALSKERWDKLQAEYVEYRQSLLSRIAVDATAGSVPNKINSTHGSESTLGSAPAAQPAPAPAKPQSYPAGCVLFARHVPPDTNKTALRTRFSALLADAAALDYVDYTKGLDSCYLRLTAPEHAQTLLAAVQSDQSANVQELELLEGRREEVYWENVPEKVRALAVQRAHAQVHQTQRDDISSVSHDSNAADDNKDTGGASHASGTGRRKRRR